MAQLGLDYPTKWGRGYTARFVRSLFQSFFLSPVIRRMSSLEVRGVEHITGRGPFIFVANHTSNLDTPLVLTALPKSERKRTVVAAALDTFFMDSRRAFQTVLFYNGIPIERHKVNRRSALQALELIEDHWNLLIYPEGGRSPDGILQQFKGGAAYLADRQPTIKSPGTIIGILVILVPPWILVMLQPDLGTSLVLVATVCGLLFMSGASLFWLGTLATAVVAAVPFVWSAMADYQKARLLTLVNFWADPSSVDTQGAGYQISQAKLAVETGGLAGKGLTNGNVDLPVATTDFVWGVLAEELGFLGAMVVLALFVALLWRLLV